MPTRLIMTPATVTDENCIYENGVDLWFNDGSGNLIRLTAGGSVNAPGGGTPGNPTATIGLSVINGSASTYMRSDAAPPLDQGIVPTWTGLHTFNIFPITPSSAPTTNFQVANKKYVDDTVTGGYVPLSRTLTAGAGLTGGGDLSADRTFDIGAGTGITVNANDVALTVPVTAILGGTGQTTYTLGDVLYSSAANVLSKLAGNIIATRKFLRQTGTGAVSAAPVWDTILAADIPSSALTKTDDTNVTLTLGGSPSSALLAATSLTLGWAGTLAAGRLNSNVVQAITNDTNVTGSIATQTLTLGWTGTLAAARLNANVVQSIVNDTNVTGSISAQALTLGWTGTLSVARGGTGSSTGLDRLTSTNSTLILSDDATNQTLTGNLGSLIFKSGVANGASAIGIILNTTNSITTNGSKILSIQSAGTEILNVQNKTSAPAYTILSSYPKLLKIGYSSNWASSIVDAGWWEFGAGPGSNGSDLYSRQSTGQQSSVNVSGSSTGYVQLVTAPDTSNFQQTILSIRGQGTTFSDYRLSLYTADSAGNQIARFGLTGTAVLTGYTGTIAAPTDWKFSSQAADSATVNAYDFDTSVTLANAAANHTRWRNNTTVILTLGEAGLLTVTNKITGLTQATGTTDAVAGGRTITAGTGLTGGGDLTANRTLTLDQGVVPTWTGTHTFSLQSIHNAGLKLKTTGTIYALFDTASLATSDKTFTFPNASGTFALTTNLPVGGDPSANIGLSVINGTSTDFMRSNAAPALSQSIVPTWTGVHTFSAEDVHNAGVSFGTSGRLDSSVADAVAAISFLIKPTVALTSGTDRSLFRITDSSANSFMDLRADGTFQFNGTGVVGGYFNIAGTVTTAAQGINFIPVIQNAGVSQTGFSGNAVEAAFFSARDNNTGTNASCVGGYFEAIGTVTGGTRAHTDMWAGVFRVNVNGGSGSSEATVGSIKSVGYARSGMGTAATNAYGAYFSAHTSGTNRYQLYIEEQSTGTIGNGIFMANGTSGYKAIAIRDQNSWIGSNSANELNLSGASFISVDAGDLRVTTVGKGLQIKEGTNAKMGTAVLVLGTLVVNTTAVTANSRIFLTAQVLGTVAVPQALAVTARTAGTSFTITSANATDTSTVAWMMVEPA